MVNLQQHFNGKPLQHVNNLLELLKTKADGISNMVGIPSTVLTKMFHSGDTRNICMKKLKELKVIEEDPYYSAGNQPGTTKRTKRYRLHNDYLPEDKKSNLSMKAMNMSDIITEDEFWAMEPGFVKMFGDPELQKEEVMVETIQEPKDYVEKLYSHKGIGEPELIRIYKKDIELFKQTRIAFEEEIGEPWEDGLITECIVAGIKKEVAQYLYYIYSINKPVNKSNGQVE